jgi:hypothetical protein
MGSHHLAKEKRLVIVGNAPVLTYGPIQPKVSSRFLRRFINESDLVVRMNDIKNRGAREIGRRTDILAIMNCGLPKYFQGKLISRRMTRELQEILFVVQDKEVQQFRSNASNELNQGKKFAEKILKHQEWTEIPAYFTDDSQMLELAKKLNSIGNRKCIASTGIRVIEHILNQSRFDDYKIYLLGFGFKGWKGHNFGAERNYIEERLKSGLIHIPREPTISRSTLMDLIDGWVLRLTKILRSNL